MAEILSNSVKAVNPHDVRLQNVNASPIDQLVEAILGAFAGGELLRGLSTLQQGLPKSFPRQVLFKPVDHEVFFPFNGLDGVWNI